MRLSMLAFLMIVAVTFPACVAHNCVNKITPDICPVGSTIDVNATMEGNGSGGAELSYQKQEGSIKAVVVSKDQCQFVCRPQCSNPTKITRQEITCGPPVQAQCVSAQKRCVNESLQVCGADSTWQPVTTCPTGQACVDTGGTAACVARSQ
jgi:hypothetical protein